MTAPLTDAPTGTKTELVIPCECAGTSDPSHVAGGCDRPADVWVIMHDVCGDCRDHEGGQLSLYMCHGCWDPLAAELALKLQIAASSRAHLRCMSCGLHFHRWTDVVQHVSPIQGTKR